LPRRLGCGVSWNTTNLDLEIVAAAFNQMVLFLDDMHKAEKEDVKAIIEIMNGEGRGRWTEAQRASFCTPLLSTSNTSGIAIARALKMTNQIEALIDRLADLALPNGCPYFFEGIHTPQEFRAYGEDRLRQLSRANFGLAGPEFVRRLAKAIEADRALIQAFVDERQRTYWDAADSIKSLWERDLTRISDKFATIYIAGCLAIRFTILPFTETELLEALLTCERDHVAFIGRELGVLPARAMSAYGAPTAIAKQTAITGVAVPARTPFDRLRRYIDDNRQRRYIKHSSRRGFRRGFINPRLSRLDFKLRLRRLKGAPVLGYIADGEYWIPGDRFEEVAGGSREAAALKKELFSRGLLETDRRREGVSYVVKRPLPDGSRPYFVVLRQKAKMP